MKSVGIYLDIANLYYCVNRKWEGRRIDYTKLTRGLVGDNVIYRAVAYGLQYDTESTSFIGFMRHLGYEAKYRRPRTYRDSTGKAHERRTSWSMGIAMDIVDAVQANKLDQVILGSSDGDLASMIKWLKEHGVDVIVVSCGISSELRRECEQCIELTEEYLLATTKPA